jgi:hypothetical protein
LEPYGRFAGVAITVVMTVLTETTPAGREGDEPRVAQ